MLVGCGVIKRKSDSKKRKSLGGEGPSKENQRVAMEKDATN